MHVCTIVARNYLAQARVLGRSLRAVDPEATLWVLVVDGVHEGLHEPFELVDPAELELGEDLAVMRLIYDVTELSTAVKPALLRALLRRTGGPVTYLDPDIEIFSSLHEVDALARAHGLVLTPHLLAPLPSDERQPTDVDILLSGAYNLGFVSMADRPDVHGLLDWWDGSLRRDCIIDHSRGRFVDQRFMDLAPGFVRDHYVLRDPGYNVAYWNLSQRVVKRNGDGVVVDGQPLRFFHYSGFDPRRPLRISKHQSRFTFDDLPVVAELYAAYGASLRSAGFVEQARLDYGYDRTASGIALDRPLRRLARKALLEGELAPIDVFGEDGDRAFRSWLSTPEADGPLAGLPHVLVWVASGRDDVTALFGEDPAGLLGWAREYGVLDEPALAHVLPYAVEPVGAAAGPPSAVASAAVASPEPAGRTHPWGVNVAGFLRAELGIGEAARNALAALDEAHVPAIPVEGSFVPSSRHTAEPETVAPSEAPFSTNLLCVNPDVLERWVDGVDPSFWTGRHTIGFWWWEVQHIPSHFRASFDLVDEIWVGSRFVMEAFAAASDKPVVQVRVPVVVPPTPPMSRAALGLPEGFVFLYLFDFNSSLGRKNPLGLIDAFARAFAPGEGASLVVKSINADKHPENAALLAEAATGHPHVHLIDRYVSAAERYAMLESADCYVSLHRSEGLGLTLAESMFLGKPVIATGWSGNLDFMTPANSHLVRWELTDVGAAGAPYPAQARWAEPDLDHAASLMRGVFDDPAAAAALGARASADVRATHSLQAAAESMVSRLDAIRELQGPERPPVAGPGIRALADDVRRYRSGSSLPRRLLLKALRPVTFHQDRLLDGLVDAAADLDVRLRASDLRAQVAGARTLAEQRRLRRLARQGTQVAGVVADGLGRLGARVDDVSARADAALGPVQELRESAPDPSTLPFSSFEVDGAGTVYGFQGELGASSASDRYRRFEDLFRGDEATIASRQVVYLPLLADHGPVLDVGCGRGELLELLREAGIGARGVDLDAGMVAHCVAKGLEVAEGDGVAVLRALEDGSLGAIFAAQVIEHLPYDVFQEFFALAGEKLRPGGLLITETVNPHSQVALKHFWLDLTHEQPIFPEVALATAGLAGFHEAYIFYPGGSGDAATDRPRCGDYALVATR